MTNFRKAHAIAKVLTGDYSARISFAWELIKKNDFSEVAELIDLNTLKPKMYVSIHAGSASPAKISKKPNKVVDNKSKSNKTTTAKIFLPVQLDSINEHFTTSQAQTVYEYIIRFVEHANKHNSVHLDEKRYTFNDGIEALSKATEMIGLQSTMIIYFLRDYTLKLANRFLQMGIGFKNKSKKLMGNVDNSAYRAKQENAQSYQKASSNARDIHEYSAMDIYHTLIVDSYEKEFSEKMFDVPSNVMQSIFFRVSNVMQTQMTALRNQIKVKMNIKGMYNEFIEQGAQLDEQAFNIAQDMDIFSDAELEIIKLRITGFNKVEIDEIIGKRTDRTFNNMKKLFVQAV